MLVISSMRAAGGRSRVANREGRRRARRGDTGREEAAALFLCRGREQGRRCLCEGDESGWVVGRRGKERRRIERYGRSGGKIKRGRERHVGPATGSWYELRNIGDDGCDKFGSGVENLDDETEYSTLADENGV
jgi:hypothetical protein